MINVPSGLTGESSNAQNAARQYEESTSMVAMSGEAIMVTMAEATTSVRTLTRDMRYPVAMLVLAPMTT